LVKGKNSRYVPGHNPNSRLVDLTGRRFGKLLVLHKVVKSNRSAAYWLCRCNCGNEIIATGWALQHKNYKSCGCNKKLAIGEANFNRLFYAYKKSAKLRGIYFGITKDEFKNLSKRVCSYCGEGPNQIRHRNLRNGNGDYAYNGLDRLDSGIGYVSNNIVPCCGSCNRAKGNLSYEDFVNRIVKIYNFLKSKDKI
jgi:hypothetical protein